VVVTPERQLLREKAIECNLPGEGGYLGVLPGHAPLITEWGSAELSYHDPGARSRAVASRLRFLADRPLRAETTGHGETRDSWPPGSW